MSENINTRDCLFSFTHLDSKTFPSLKSKDNREYFMKWGMKGRISSQMYSFDQGFQPYQKDDFIKAFFTDPKVVNSLQVVGDKSCTWSALGMPADSVAAEFVPCSILSMSFFDRLQDDGKIARESGKLVRCFDEFLDDFTISDELRKMLLMDDSDNYCLYSDTQREEFLFRLFKHFCLGGRICQYEESIDPYLDITKQVYKELISVQKNPETKELHIISNVFKVAAYDDKGNQYYPGDQEHDQNFSYLIVDPLKRHVIVFYHQFGVGEVE